MQHAPALSGRIMCDRASLLKPFDCFAEMSVDEEDDDFGDFQSS